MDFYQLDLKDVSSKPTLFVESNLLTLCQESNIWKQASILGALEERMSSRAQNRRSGQDSPYKRVRAKPFFLSFPGPSETIFCQMYPKLTSSTIVSETLFIDFRKATSDPFDFLFVRVSCLDPRASLGSELIRGSLC